MARPRSARAPALAAVLAAAAALAVAGCGGGSSSSMPAPPATTATPAAGGDGAVTIWAVGDGADGSDASRRLGQLVVAEDPERLIYLGDVYEDGTAEEFADNYEPAYGRLAGRTAPTPGNHEWPNHVEGYDAYWQKVRGKPMPRWYTFRAGGWEFIGLNSETSHGPRSAQVKWLERHVADGGTCRIAFWHRPRISAGRHGDNSDMEPFWNALSGRARIVLGGHDHDLQRFKEEDGLVQYVSGAGGNERYEVRHDDARLAFSNDTHFGGLRLDLRPGVARLRFITIDGQTLDDSTVRCR